MINDYEEFKEKILKFHELMIQHDAVKSLPISNRTEYFLSRVVIKMQSLYKDISDLYRRSVTSWESRHCGAEGLYSSGGYGEFDLSNIISEIKKITGLSEKEIMSDDFSHSVFQEEYDGPVQDYEELLELLHQLNDRKKENTLSRLSYFIFGEEPKSIADMSRDITLALNTEHAHGPIIEHAFSNEVRLDFRDYYKFLNMINNLEHKDIEEEIKNRIISHAKNWYTFYKEF